MLVPALLLQAHGAGREGWAPDLPPSRREPAQRGLWGQALISALRLLFFLQR